MAEREVDGMIRPLDVVAVWGLRLGALLAAPLLVLFARTWRGRLIGLAVLQAMLLVGSASSVLYFILAWTTPSQPYRAILGAVYFSSAHGLIICGALAIGYLLLSLPSYRSDTPGVRSVFLGPTFLHRWQMAILDEQDWLWLGVQLGTRFDFRIGRDEARGIRERVRALLDELKEVPDGRDVPPAWPLAVWGKVFRPDHGHLLVYRPNFGGPPVPHERLGLFVFLHGHGGNTLLFPHLLREFADSHRFVVVCPSFGYGNWEHPDTPAAVRRAVHYAVEHFAEIDPSRVYLAGLSQGGAGVGRATVAMPDTFAGLIFLSATMEPTVLAGGAFAGRRVLVLHGDRDRHVTPHSLEAGVASLRGSGADITVCRDPAGTHFLFFDQTEEVLRQVGDWVMPSSLPPPYPAPG